MKITNKFLLVLVLTFSSIGIHAQCEYEEKQGLVIMEAENTTSPYDLWVLKTDVSDYKGSGHLEFTGNRTRGGDPKSPLEYTFKINQGGTYQILLRCRKRITPPDGSDKSNDAYVRVEGDYEAAGGGATLETLMSDTKLFGGKENSWGWASRLDLGQHNGGKKNPKYIFKAGETYKLVMNGRSKQFNVDRIIFYRTSDYSAGNAQDTQQNMDETRCGPNVCVENPSFVEAECYSSQSGVQSEPCDEGGLNIGYINNEDWMVYNDIDLTNTKSINTRVACNFAGGTIEVRLGSTTGRLIGSVPVTNTGGNQIWETVSANIENVTGTQDLYLVFKGGNGYLFNINYFGFSDVVLSTDDNEIGNINVFPNPVLNTLHINNGKELSFKVYNSLGQLQFENKIISDKYTIDMSGFSSGIYFLKTVDGKTTTIQKIIKN